MRNLFSNLRLIPKRATALLSVSIVLLVLSTLQVECPVCNAVAEQLSGDQAKNLKVLDLKWEFLELQNDHIWCVYALMNLTYRVDIVIANEGSKPLAIPLLLKGMISKEEQEEEHLLGQDTWVIDMEIDSKETKQFEVVVNMKLHGWLEQEVLGVPKMVFLITTDPDEIKAECPVCDGNNTVPLFEMLKEIVR